MREVASALVCLALVVTLPTGTLAWRRNDVGLLSSSCPRIETHPSRQFCDGDLCRTSCFQDLMDGHHQHERLRYSPLQSMILMLRGGDIQYPTSMESLDVLLEDAATNGQLVVIDFYNDDCPPCEKVAPLFLELSESEEFILNNAVVFIKIKVNDNLDIATRYGITGWPTFLFIKNKVVQTEIVGGALAEATLYDWIRLFTTVPKKTEKANHDEGNNHSGSDEDPKG